MKHRPLPIVLTLLLLSQVTFSADPEITTTELARHLGISTWRIPKEKLPDSYIVKMYHVSKGTLIKEFVIGEFQNGGALLICAHWTSPSVSMSLDNGTTIISTRGALLRRPVFTVENKFEGLGIPLLLCSGTEDLAGSADRIKNTTSEAHTMALSRADHGLAIVIAASKR